MILAENLSRTYPGGSGEITVLDGVDLSIDRGACVAIVGPSGSGKSTLLGLLAGLDRPTTGRVWLDGVRLDGIGEDERARLRADRVGFVFQTFELLSTLTALENVQVPIELRPRRVNGGRVNAREVEARGRALLDRVGLADRAHHYPVQLSGGEQQRVSLARAFAHQPAVLFADEPTGNLDPATGERVIRLLRDLNEEAGTTLVLVTHDPAVAAFADRTVRIDRGRLVDVEDRG